MPKKKPANLRPDVAETAFRTMLEATGEAPRTLPPSERGEGEKNSEAVKRGAKGGQTRSKGQSSEVRSQIARNAALKRWTEHGKK